MCVVNGVADRPKQFQSFSNVELVVIAIGVEGLTLDELHDEVGEAIVGWATGEQSGNGRVVKPCEYLPLFAEPTKDEVGIHSPLHKFNCGSFVKLVIGTRRLIHRAPPPPPRLAL